MAIKNTLYIFMRFVCIGSCMPSDCVKYKIRTQFTLYSPLITEKHTNSSVENVEVEVKTDRKVNMTYVRCHLWLCDDWKALQLRPLPNLGTVSHGCATTRERVTSFQSHHPLRMGSYRKLSLCTRGPTFWKPRDLLVLCRLHPTRKCIMHAMCGWVKD